MTRIVLVRHGETVWHAENRYAGRSDIALSERGLQQAEMLGKWARNAGLSNIWASPLIRSRATSQPASDSTGIEMKIDDRLLELDFGQGEGLTASEMAAQFHSAYEAFLIDPVKNYLPGGEDPVRAAARGRACLQAIAEAGGDGSRILVVAHNTLFRLVLCDLLEVPLSKYRDLFPSLKNNALTEIDLGPRQFSLLSLNVPIEENQFS